MASSWIQTVLAMEIQKAEGWAVVEITIQYPACGRCEPPMNRPKRG
jgi:hypothetical protein